MTGWVKMVKGEKMDDEQAVSQTYLFSNRPCLILVWQTVDQAAEFYRTGMHTPQGVHPSNMPYGFGTMSKARERKAAISPRVTAASGQKRNGEVLQASVKPLL